MARVKGAHNRSYEDRRRELAERLRVRLTDPEAPRASYRELAKAAGVGVTTLRHYFPDRETLVAEVIRIHAPGGERHLAYLRQPQGPFAASVRDAAAYIALGLMQPVVRQLHEIGLGEGLGRPGVGSVYLTVLLEPMIEALERRLQAHVAAGEMRPADLRAAAVGLAAPILVAQLHQRALGGDVTRPLDVEAFLATHVEAFVRGYGA